MKLKKLTISAMLVAVAVILSSFSIPIGPSRCFPIQHLCNVLAAVFLGPVYGVSMAFCTALIRNLLGTGSLLAFPGSMVGAFVSAMIFKYTRSKIGAYLGEVIGTGILGGMLCYPIASMMMGQKAALFTFVGPFLASTLCGTVIAAVIITGMIGAVLAPYMIRMFHVRNPVADGLAIGASSHALGTSRALEMGELEGAMSGIAVGVSGLLTVLFSLVLG